MPNAHQSYAVAQYGTNPIRASTYAMIQLLRDNISLISNRVYPSGLRQDAKLPRITVAQLTPSEKRLGIGEIYSSGKGVWRMCTFKIDCWDRTPTGAEEMGDRVITAIWDNRGYRDSTNIPNGYFVNLEIAGGGITDLNPGMQVYQKTIMVKGRWLQTTVAVP